LFLDEAHYTISRSGGYEDFCEILKSLPPNVQFVISTPVVTPDVLKVVESFERDIFKIYVD
jgi:hypothetical protein